MTNFSYTKMREFVNADPELTKLREAKNAAYRKIDALKKAAQEMLNKQHSLYITQELVKHKMHSFDGYTEEEDQIIEQVSGYCSECWSYEWSSSAEVLLEGMLGQSLILADIAHKIEKCNEDSDDMRHCIEKMEKTLEDQYKKQVTQELEKAKQRQKELLKQQEKQDV